MDLINCKKKRFVKEIILDSNLIKSLIESAKNKLSTQELITLNAVTATSKVCLTYDSLRELLEALAVKNGYKIYNHECYTAFLREVMDESLLAGSFDEMRKLRNAINYYGKKISLNEAKEIISELKKLINKVKRLL